MVLTLSQMMPLDTEAPGFELLDVVTGKYISLASAQGAGGPLLMMFLCCHCPYVKHIEGELSALAKQYQDQGISVVAINSNDIENYPEDAPDKMVLQASRLGWTFPYLFDETQAVAKSYGATCTPDFFLFAPDGNGRQRLVYRGQMDGSRPGNVQPVTGTDLTQAVQFALQGQRVPEAEQLPSMGCNIKWKIQG